MKRARTFFKAGTVSVPWILFAALALTMVQGALAQDLEETLSQVGEEYAVAYSSPFLHAFGPSLNSGMYHTAAIPHTTLTIGFAVKGMAAKLSDEDQTFTRVMQVDDLGVFDPDFDGVEGTVVMTGPTVFGSDEVEGSIIGYVNGLPVFEQEGLEGLWETDFVPMVTPELSVGGVWGLRAVFRYLPEVEIEDVGKFKYFGWGLQWNTGEVLKNLPVDLMVGYGSQKLEVGTVLETNASMFYVAASRQFSILTLYGGIGFESSDMTVTYTYESDDLDQDISFEVDGAQDSRLTIGGTLDLGLKLNAEIAKGSAITTMSAGLILGF
ncbi:hypothetical protein KJ682_18510 [bacterium]|nr:hypothetical protein [bacterium]